MIIVEFIPQLGTGGAERFTIDLCNKLSEENNVYLLVSHDLAKFGHYTKEISDKVHVVSFNKKNGFDISLFLKVYKAIKKIKPDVVHTHLMSIVYITLCCILYRVPKYFHTIHNSAEKESDGKIGYLFRKLLFKTKLVKPITISNESKQSFVQYYGMDAPVILNGRDIPEKIEISDTIRKEIKSYKFTDKTKIIVQLAHVGYQKRQDVMAKVVKRLVEEGYDLCVLMIGAHDEPSMVEYINSLSCDRIHMLGVKSNPLEYLSVADAFGLTSSYEGLPISLIEAMGIGIIPICTPVGGIKDIIKNGINGFMSETIKAEDYYVALKRYLMLTDKEISEMKYRIKDTYSLLTMEKCAHNYLNIFNHGENVR